MSETVHACCIAMGGRAVLIVGPSGSGKSDLSLRMLDRGADLVSDDYTELAAEGGRLLASPPERIAGRIEVRGVGIVERPHLFGVPLALVVELGGAPERMPDPRRVTLAGVDVPAIALAALEASAPIKLEAALHLYGLPVA